MLHLQDLIAPVLIFQCLEQYDFMGATVIGTVLLAISLVIMLLVNWIQRWEFCFPVCSSMPPVSAEVENCPDAVLGPCLHAKCLETGQHQLLFFQRPGSGSRHQYVLTAMSCVRMGCAFLHCLVLLIALLTVLATASETS